MDWERPSRRGAGADNLKDLEEFFRRLKNRYDMSSTRGPLWILLGIILALFIALNSYYTVEPQETAVVQRFGKFVKIAESGLHFKIPFGIETVRKVVTGRVLQREYGYRTIEPGVRSRYAEKGHEEESIMLSGDLNVIDLQWTVQYKIKNPVDYLFRVHEVESTLDDMSESVVRRIAGNRFADEILTVGRASIADMAQSEIQFFMDLYATGIEIVTVKLQNVNPPNPVKAAFNEVNEARQEKERMINEAQQLYNQRIPRALGEARQAVNQAEGYALERVNRSQGEARRFLDILAEYEKSPYVTRRRMYFEAYVDFIARVDRLLVVDEEQKHFLPFLDMSRMSMKSKAGEGGQSDTSPSHLMPFDHEEKQ